MDPQIVVAAAQREIRVLREVGRYRVSARIAVRKRSRRQIPGIRKERIRECDTAVPGYRSTISEERPQCRTVLRHERRVGMARQGDGADASGDRGRNIQPA